VWNVSKEQVEQILEGHLDLITSIASLPDSSKLVSASSDQTVRVWNVGKEQVEQPLKAHSVTVIIVGLLPDGSKLASALDGRTLLVLNIGLLPVVRRRLGISL
jgi:WD40 repeat protein